MDPATASIVSVLAAGAAAIGKGIAGEAAKDAYKSLKSWLVGRREDTGAAIALLERDPASGAKQAVLAEEVAPLAAEAELRRLVAALSAAIAGQAEKQDEVAALIDLGSLRAAGNFELTDSQALGAVLRVRGDATFEKDVKLSGLSNRPERGAKKND
ncbi:hypothetical protein [Falsiroseomonas oryzae]|uniref:hypothetical protein n=1 Tax=Falsiroseomonas oryzae TaxID=2766473 RepID=UPI0022EAB1CA|nr:hypothetical protein [Roseomonas sp. MO-31]